MARVEFFPSTRADFDKLYNGEFLPRAFYGLTAKLEGEVLGIVGLYFNKNWIAFTRITDEGRNYPVSIWRAATKLIAMMQKLALPVYAIADPAIPKSDQLLIKMGFTQVSKDWYVWIP